MKKIAFILAITLITTMVFAETDNIYRFGSDSMVTVLNDGSIYFYVNGFAAKAIYENMKTPPVDTRLNGDKTGEITRAENGISCKRQIFILNEDYICQFYK